MPYSSVSGICSPLISFNHPGASLAFSKSNKPVSRTLSIFTFPSDIGIIKPSGGFNLGAALAGLGAFFGASQFFYYANTKEQ